MPPSTLCTFTCADLLFGVDVRAVQEVVRNLPVTPVPIAPPEVCGLINLRGQVVSVVDLRRRLGLPPRATRSATHVIVTAADGSATSLLVDEVGDVRDVPAERWAPVPASVEGAAREVTLGVFRLDGPLLLLLDVERAVTPQPATR